MELEETWEGVESRAAEDAEARLREKRIHLHSGYEWCSAPARIHTFLTYLTQHCYEAAEHALQICNMRSCLHNLSVTQFV